MAESNLGVTLAEFTDMRVMNLAERSKSLLVHITCIRPDGACGGLVNGFFYQGQPTLVMTVAHALGLGGAVKYKASFCDVNGKPYDNMPLRLLKVGYSTDLAVFELDLPPGLGFNMPVLAPPMPAAQPGLGVTT